MVDPSPVDERAAAAGDDDDSRSVFSAGEAGAPGGSVAGAAAAGAAATGAAVGLRAEQTLPCLARRLDVVLISRPQKRHAVVAPRCCGSFSLHLPLRYHGRVASVPLGWSVDWSGDIQLGCRGMGLAMLRAKPIDAGLRETYNQKTPSRIAS